MHYRSHEPLYTVIARMKNAEAVLRSFAKQHKLAHKIDANRLHLFDANSMSVFQINWPHGYEQITIWDTWNKRHLHLDIGE